MRKIIVITGATSGIGNTLAELFKNENNIVINLSRTATLSATSFPCDVSNEEDVKKAFEFIKEKHGKIDILINNAGYGISGATELVSNEDAEKIFQTNFFGVFSCSKYALPLMNKGARIVNISSACAIFPLPYRSLYCASKAAVSMLSLSMRMELSFFGIDVVSICPGDVKTNFTKNRVKKFETNERYENRIENATSKIDSLEHKRMSSNYVAKKILKICNKKKTKPQYIIGTKYKIFYFLSRIFPQSIFNKIIEKMFGGKNNKKT